VFELLCAGGLGDFYRLGGTAGVPGRGPVPEERFAFLDVPEVRARIVDYSDERVTRVTFRVPAIHCLACIWLLENLFHLRPGIGQSRVNFLRREVLVTFETGRVRLGEVAALLASLGYEPDLKSSDLEARPSGTVSRRLWLQLGVAGFAFGNSMLFAIAGYLGLDSLTGPAFRTLTGRIQLLLALPVILYSASGYWRSAWTGLRNRVPVIEIPIAAGILALFGQSLFEVVSGSGEGYFDSLAGLLFFLLCGQVFQRKTYDRLAFDRDYRSFFPLAVTRLRGAVEERVALSQLAVGDRLVLRNGELIPADSRLVRGEALVDYAFVTGESQPVAKAVGELLHAGGRQTAGAIEVEMSKPVSQGYLTSLWNQDAFRKDRGDDIDRITNGYSRRFTWIILAIAVGSALAWIAAGDTPRGLKAFTSVLIVACPCALALAAPFTLGTAQRILGRAGVFLKNPNVAATLARVDAVVFDKTGTLTTPDGGSVAWIGEPLAPGDARRVAAVARQSTHPLAARIAAATDSGTVEVRDFTEEPGKGVSANADGRRIVLGSAAWLVENGIAEEVAADAPGSAVHVAVDGLPLGLFTMASTLRPEAGRLLGLLGDRYELALLSGDNDRERGRFRALFGKSAELLFGQGPHEKLAHVRGLQERGRTVLMVGDGLNDAGALRQADVGAAVVEDAGRFSPASDIILASGMVPRLAEILGFARRSVRLVRLGFLVSGAYNVVGLAIAASGRLSPVVCAILMPLSSATVVAFACLATRRAGRRFTEPDTTIP
jgi:P-type Cu+ transporter